MVVRLSLLIGTELGKAWAGCGVGLHPAQVADIPAERLKQGVDEFPADLGFIVLANLWNLWYHVGSTACAARKDECHA